MNTYSCQPKEGFSPLPLCPIDCERHCLWTKWDIAFRIKPSCDFLKEEKRERKKYNKETFSQETVFGMSNKYVLSLRLMETQ